MSSHLAKLAAGSAVRAYLAEIGSVYLGKVYDPKDDGEHRRWWEATVEHFDGRCVYCNTPEEKLPRGERITKEHLIETNRQQCGLHHPGNVVPACSVCNKSREKRRDGSWPTWEQHLQEIGKKHKLSDQTVEKRRKRIQQFIDSSGYPELTEEELAYLRRTAAAVHDDVLARCTADRRGFVAIHGEEAVKLSSRPKGKMPKKAKVPSGT